MFQDKLKQIDRRLINLLSQRITILAESEPPSVKEQLQSFQQLLSQANVPEFVWENLVINCLAALAKTSSSTINCIEPRRVTIIGGRGAMGRFFTSQLLLAGHHVNILEQEDWERAEQLLSGVDLVLVCVSLQNTVEILQKTANYISPTTTLADISSLKTSSVETMLTYHPGPVLGLHPMFGPSVKTFESQKIIICLGRQESAFQWFLDLIVSEGGKLIRCTPEEHDRMMIFIQSIRHFSLFSLAVFLAKERINLDRSLELSTPLYRLHFNMIGRLFSQESSLYTGILLGTEDSCQAIAKLADTYRYLALLVAHQDRDALIKEFETARSFFKQKIGSALNESDYAISNLNRLSIANEMEPHQ